MNELRTHRRRASRRALLATLFAIGAFQLGCASPPNPVPNSAPLVPAGESLRAGLELYGAREFTRAGSEFRLAAQTARATGDHDLAHRATIAECTAWLRARSSQELCSCADTLEASQSRMRSSDPRVNTLISLGAIAGERPLPALRTPSAVRVVLRGASEARQ